MNVKNKQTKTMQSYILPHFISEQKKIGREKKKVAYANSRYVPAERLDWYITDWFLFFTGDR